MGKNGSRHGGAGGPAFGYHPLKKASVELGNGGERVRGKKKKIQLYGGDKVGLGRECNRQLSRNKHRKGPVGIRSKPHGKRKSYPLVGAQKNDPATGIGKRITLY